jgi:hypothetical protein
MTEFPYITNGPWRIHPAVVDGSATIKYEVDGKREVAASETHEDLALLRDAITEYLQVVEAK